MTDLTRRQFIKSALGTAALAAMAKATATKLGAPLFTDLEFGWFHDTAGWGKNDVLYRMTGYFQGHKAVALTYIDREMFEDSAINAEQVAFEMCYRELNRLAIEEPPPIGLTPWSPEWRARYLNHDRP